MPVPVSKPPETLNVAAANVLDWLKDSMGIPMAELHTKLRGNILHVLCETSEPLDQSAVLLKLVRTLLDADGHSLVQQHHPQVYQLYLYSRRTGEQHPDWTAPIYLNRLERHLAQLVLEHQDEKDTRAAQSLLERYMQDKADLSDQGQGSHSAMVLSNLSLARKGDPEAIAWYLSETLSALDVGVWVSIKAIPGTARLHRMAIGSDDLVATETLQDLSVPQVDTDADDDPADSPGLAAGPESETTDAAAIAPDTNIPRLWILCEATYSPDPSLIARPTAERLRQLQLTQFKDAVLLLQVRGESKPDWSLRIDLTPPEEMLREWGRWGDVDAIARLLSVNLESWHLRVDAEAADTTLHLVCQPQSGDHDTQQMEGIEAKDQVVAAITSTLDTLAPQGLHRAVIYGQGSTDAPPHWVHYLDLPAAEHAALADAPEYLGQIGDLPALAFLLTRLLNPNLDDRLATGGLRVQLLLRDQLLHVMVDSPVTPHRRLVAPPIKAYLMDLSPSGIEGVRIYGRRSGQLQPAWSYGKDFFDDRPRLVPESTPEFTASDAYVNELLVRPDGPGVHGPVVKGDLATDLEDDEDLALGAWVADWVDQGRHLLVQSHLFTSQDPEAVVESVSTPSIADGVKIAVVWAAVGILATLQIDWLLGQVLSPPTNPAKADPIVETSADQAGQTAPRSEFEEDLAQLTWPGQNGAEPGGFGDRPAEERFTSVDGETITLATSPDQPMVAIDQLVAQAPYDTFNSQQLNEKVALYNQRLEQSGPPDVLIVGSSRALRGVDPAALRQELAAMGHSNLSVFNFGINGATAQVVDLVIRQVLKPDQQPQLIIWADGARAFNSGRVDVTYDAIVASPGYRELLARRADDLATDPTVDAAEASELLSNGQAADSLPNSYVAMDTWMSEQLANLSAVHGERSRLKTWLQDRLIAMTPSFASTANLPEEALDAPIPEGSVIDYDGFLPLSVRFNPATYYQNYARVSGRYDGDYDSFQLDGQQSDAFGSLLSFTQAQNIPIVFINTPLTDEYLDDYRQEAEAQFLQHMLRLSTRESGFLFRDFGDLWPTRYDYFSDPSHLNRYGAYQVSNQLAQDPLIAWPKSSPQP